MTLTAKTAADQAELELAPPGLVVEAPAIAGVPDDGLEPKETRGLDASKQQEVADAQERDHLLAQENVGLPVPGFGLGPMGPGAVPSADAAGLQAKAARSIREHRELDFMACRAVATEALPAGTCAIVSGIALRYGVLDDWGTTFTKGCIDLTRSQKLPLGRIQFYVKNTSGSLHTYGMNTLVGTVVALEDVGDDVLMTAHLTDTDHGRAIRDQLKAMLAQDGFVGLSIGFRVRKSAPQMVAGKRIQQITEIELMEVSIVPMASVPGTAVLAVRSPQEQEEQLRAALQSLPQARIAAVWEDVFHAARSTAERTDTRARERADTGGAPKASEQDRVAAYRRSLVRGSVLTC